MKSREVKIKVDTEKKDADRIYHFVRGKKSLQVFFNLHKNSEGFYTVLGKNCMHTVEQDFPAYPIPCR